MSEHSAIEWTGATWSPIYGCTKVDPACGHCYIERQPPYRTRRLRFENGRIPIQLLPDRLDPEKVRRLKPLDRPIFVCSLSDLFHEDVPSAYIGRVFDVIEACPERTFQVLTKRIERARDWLISFHHGRYACEELPANVWMGTTIGNARYTWRADVLREIPAAVTFVSAEPLLGSLLIPRGSELPCSCFPGASTERPIDSDRLCNPWKGGCGGVKVLDLTGIDWVIVGGESGPGARPMHPDWARELRDACLVQALHDDYRPGRPRPAFFFKQWGGRTPKSGGRLLDGREWNEMPVKAAAPSGEALPPIKEKV